MTFNVTQQRCVKCVKDCPTGVSSGVEGLTLEALSVTVLSAV